MSNPHQLVNRARRHGSHGWDDRAVAEKYGPTGQDRIDAIQNCAEAAGRSEMADHIAFETDLSVDTAKRMLSKAPQDDDGSETIALARKLNLAGIRKK